MRLSADMRAVIWLATFCAAFGLAFLMTIANMTLLWHWLVGEVHWQIRWGYFALAQVLYLPLAVWIAAVGRKVKS